MAFIVVVVGLLSKIIITSTFNLEETLDYEIPTYYKAKANAKVIKRKDDLIKEAVRAIFTIKQ